MAAAKFDKKFVWACCLVGTGFVLITVVVQYILGKDAGNVAAIFLAALGLGILKQYPSLRFGRTAKAKLDVPKIDWFGPIECAGILMLLLVLSAASVLIVQLTLLLENGPFQTQDEAINAGFAALEKIRASPSSGENAMGLLWFFSFVAVGTVAGTRYPTFLAILYSGSGAWLIMALPTIIWTVLRIALDWKGYNTEGSMNLLNFGFFSLFLPAMTMATAAVISTSRAKK